MKLAHVRGRRAPAGSPWRLAAALDEGVAPRHWVDLEVARRRAIAARPSLAHGAVLFRHPVTTLDDHLGRGLRVGALVELMGTFAPRGAPTDDDALIEGAEVWFGPPVLRPPSFRDFFAFERHVRRTWARRGGEIPEPWYRLPIFYFSNVSEIRGPDAPVWAPRGSEELDYELEVGAIIDTPARDLPAERGEEAIGGYVIVNDWSARDLQREESTLRLGPAKGKDFALSIGPWLVTPDEITDARRPGATGPDLTMTATVHAPDGSGSRVVDSTGGNWAAAHFSFGQMIERASTDVTLRPGDLLGSGTVGGGCLLETRDETLGRYLLPGDEVVLEIERLGVLRTPVVARPV